MTISSSIRRAGPYVGNGSTIAFPFNFKVFEASDVRVSIGHHDGTQTVLQLGADYTVTLNPDQNHAPGGTVTFPIAGSPLPLGSPLAITGALSYEQPTDITNQGGFYPQIIEDALDRAVIQIQQLVEATDRSIKVRETDIYSADELRDALLGSASKASNAALRAESAAVESVIAAGQATDARDLILGNESVQIVAANIGDVHIVADAIDDVQATASSVTAIESVAADLGGTWEAGVTYDFGLITHQPGGATSPAGGNIATVANNIDDLVLVAENVDALLAIPIAANAAADRAELAAEEVMAGVGPISYQSFNATDALDLTVRLRTAARVNLTEPVCTLSLTPDAGAAYANSVRTVDIILEQGTGANKVNWPGTVRWPHGLPPVLSFEQNDVDMVRLMTLDNGSTWIGSHDGGW